MATLTRLGTGDALTHVAADVAGDKFSIGSGRLHVVNGGGGDVTVTVISQAKCSFGSLHNLTYVVTAGTDKFLPPFDSGRFDDGSGFVQVTYDEVTSVTVAVIG
jgi:hypothetical protein